METTPLPKVKTKKLSFKGFFAFSIAPHRQFKVIVWTIGLLLLISAGFHYYLFQSVSAHTFFEAPTITTSQNKGVNEKKLAGVISHFEEKAKTQTEAFTKAPVVASPEK
jgi:hypothetical protein